ncbi:hypothetical protein C1A38_12520 [Verrucosispora sp. ts21]|uniref:hypothetical protein n=1 Tax=Verrucosispora sp. ts21 TaxID=2069341 RepID=UPI000C88D069|nr:hypothetical protein [Verrucosispora sp. ts21]PMR60739.1 hypothetical protein C1A38_12520 [Verrucosispora sp. ts21]
MARAGQADAFADLDDLFTNLISDQQVVRAVLCAQLRDAARRTDLLVVLVAYLHSRINGIWDLYADQRGLPHAVIEVLDAELPEHLAALRSADSDAHTQALAEQITILAEQIRLVPVGMSVSSAINCSCPDAAADLANHVVTASEDQIGRMQAIRDGDKLTEWLVGYAHEIRDYYEALSRCAKATHRFLAAGRKPENRQPANGGVGREFLAGEIAEQIEHLTQIQRRHPPTAWLSSDLAAGTATLRVMHDWVKRDFLHVADATVVYIYPFTIAHSALGGLSGRHGGVPAPGRQSVDGPEGDAGDADPISVIRRLYDEQRLRVHGRPVSAIVDDAVGDDWGPESDYRVLTVSLPPVQITMTNALRTQETFAASLRISSVGNHSLRLEGSLVDADVHAVNQALRRPTVVMGAGEQVRLADPDRTESWTRLSDYARDVIAEFLDGLMVKTAEQVVPSRTIWQTAASATALSHSLLRIRSLQIVAADGTVRPARGSEISDPSLVGSSLLICPVGRDAVALEEWVRYRRSPDVTDLLDEYGYSGDIVLRTANTTVVSAPETPDWMAVSYSNLAEFIAALPGALLGWAADMAEHIRRARRQLDAARQLLETTSVPTVQEKAALRAAISSLEQHYIELRLVTSDVRAKINRLGSPTLLRDLIRRAYFDRLYDAAGLAVYERSLMDQIQQAEEMYQTASGVFRAFDDRMAALDSQRGRRLNTILTTAATILAIGSVAEMYGLLNDLLAPQPWVLALEVTSIGALALVMAGVVLRFGRSRAGRTTRQRGSRRRLLRSPAA